MNLIVHHLRCKKGQVKDILTKNGRGATQGTNGKNIR